MPRPKSKDELIQLSNRNYQSLNQLINSYSEEEVQNEFPPGYLNRDIRDVLGHLHHWHLMMKEWHDTGMKGEKPEMPAPGYTWKTTPDLNKEIWKKYHEVELKEVKNLLESSFNQIQELIASYSNEELFEKKRYKWTGSTSLGVYLISATSSHYDWAIKLIKKCKKES